MSLYYYNTDREIRIGDRVIMRGSRDDIDFDFETERRGTVYATVIKLRTYELGVQFDRSIRNAHSLDGTVPYGFGYWVDPVNVEPYYIDEPGVIRCIKCRSVMSAPSSVGGRLFKKMHICDDCLKREIGQVHGYHYAKRLAYRIDPDNITLGGEIEIDSPSRNWDDDEDAIDRNDFALDCVKYAIRNNYELFMSYENDGSLNEDGVECVTAPLTLKEWRSDSVKNQLDNLFSLADEYGFDFRKNNNAGLHVHIGRKSLCGGDREISDAVGLLMGWGATRLWDKGLRDLADRDENDYCTAYNHNRDLDECGGKGLRDTLATCDRYYFVNITNDKTLELRIFNRATCYEDVLLAVDVCYMLAKWATKKINAYLKRNSYSAKSKDFTDALSYADRLDWSALVKFSKYPDITLPRMRAVGILV